MASVIPPDEERCTAQSKQQMRRCRQPRRPGLTVCRWHGGGSPRSRVKTERTLVEQRARKALARIAPDRPVEDPWTELAKVAGEMVALKDQLRGKVEDLSSLRGIQGQAGETVRAELQVYTALLRDCAQTVAVMAKLGLDERMVRVEEFRARIVVAALETGLQAAGCTPSQRQAARAATARALRADALALNAPKTGPIRD